MCVCVRIYTDTSRINKGIYRKCQIILIYRPIYISSLLLSVKSYFMGKCMD